MIANGVTFPIVIKYSIWITYIIKSYKGKAYEK